MSSEQKCVTVSTEAPSSWLQYGSIAAATGYIMLLGPYKSILNKKRANQSYTLQRFRMWGTITCTALGEHWLIPFNVNSVEVYYLGRGGNEIKIAEASCNSRTCTAQIDNYLDVDTEFRGLGIQALKVIAKLNWQFNVRIDANICMELTWVG